MARAGATFHRCGWSRRVKSRPRASRHSLLGRPGTETTCIFPGAHLCAIPLSHVFPQRGWRRQPIMPSSPVLPHQLGCTWPHASGMKNVNQGHTVISSVTPRAGLQTSLQTLSYRRNPRQCGYPDVSRAALRPADSSLARAQEAWPSRPPSQRGVSPATAALGTSGLLVSPGQV